MKVNLRNLKFDDYIELKQAAIESYSGLSNAHWEPEQLKKLLDIFPEGQLCVEVNGKVVASALTIIVNYERFTDFHTYDQITAQSTFSTHISEGDTLYGIDLFVHPDFRGLRIGRRLYDARKELCESLNLKGIIFGGRMPGYFKVADKMTPKDYIEKVHIRQIYDPVLSFQFANDFHVKKVLKGYMPDDTASKEYAALLEWNNIYYTPKTDIANKTSARIGVVQWQMRLFSSFDILIEQVEYFIDAVASYNCDFAVFPEFFNAPLMAETNHLGTRQSMRALASYTEAVKKKFSEFAISYNVNIIAGSVPMIENEKLYNISFLCHRNGNVDLQKKIHITPDEVGYYGIKGGDDIKVFQTDAGKIGILICYDVEFPELARHLASQDMEILFVPFLTDTQNGYNRIRHCAMARAIENECYVAIAGCVGNLPRVSNMDIQYSQSAVFTPSDFAFPTNTVKAESTPNTEMILIADVDFNLLKELKQYGSVRNMKDRRTDLYELVWKKKQK